MGDYSGHNVITIIAVSFSHLHNRNPEVAKEGDIVGDRRIKSNIVNPRKHQRSVGTSGQNCDDNMSGTFQLCKSLEI
jgi:hypothetical protein